MGHRLALQREDALRLTHEFRAIVSQHKATTLVLQQVARQGPHQLGQVQADRRRRLVHHLSRTLTAAGIGKSYQGAYLFGIKEHAGATVEECSIINRQAFDYGKRLGSL
jgi:hypothetical protein